MKYIIMRMSVDDLEHDHPFIFPDMISHDQFAEQIQHLYLMEHGFSSECVSAGFCNFFGQKPNCSGESETLGISSRGIIDDNIIEMFNYQHGLIV